MLQATLLPLVPRAETQSAPKPAAADAGGADGDGDGDGASAAVPPQVAATPLCAPTVAAAAPGSIQSERLDVREEGGGADQLMVVFSAS